MPGRAAVHARAATGADSLRADAWRPPGAWHSVGQWSQRCSFMLRGSRLVMRRPIRLGAEGMEPLDPRIAIDAPTESAQKKLPLWGKIGIAVAVLMTIVVLAGFVIHVPYSVISPGEAVPLTGLVKVEGAKTFDKPRGDIRLLF